MPLSPAQIEARKRGVGCSEILAALGKDTRMSRLELYLHKTGELPDLDFSDNERVHFGNVLEPVIRDEFSRRTGKAVEVPLETIFHSSAPLVGDPDGWMPKEVEGLEIKTADKHEADEFGEPESDQVPVRYLVQCAGYMAVMNADKWYLAVLIGGNDFRIYEIPRDEELEQAILAGVTEFWSHVEQRRPPDPMTPEDVKLLWPRSLQPTRLCTPEIEELVYEHAHWKSEIKEAKRHMDAVEARIKHFMADAGDLITQEGRTLATWRSAKASQRFDEAQFAYEHPDLYAQYQREVEGSRRFLNNVTKEIGK